MGYLKYPLQKKILWSLFMDEVQLLNPFSPRHYLPFFPREKMSFLPGYA